MGHDQGKKSLNMFGPGTFFPVGVEIHEFRVEYEMILQAFSNIEVRSWLRKMEILHGSCFGKIVSALYSGNEKQCIINGFPR